MVERIGRYDVEGFGLVDWSGPELSVSTILRAADGWGDRVAAVMATHRPGDVLAVRSGCRPSLDGLYRLTQDVRVSDEGAGAAVTAEEATPTRAEWSLRRLRTSVHRTHVSAVERVSDIAWSVAKKATYGVPGTYVKSDAALGTPGAVNTGNGILTIVQSRVGGSIEWNVDPHRYYEGAAGIWSVYGGDPATDAYRFPVGGYWAPGGAGVVVGNSIVELWVPADNETVQLRRWTGPAIGGAWSAWYPIVIWGADAEVRAWTITRNDPDRVAITAERVAGLGRGGRVTVAVHRGSRHVELTIAGELYSLLFDDDQTDSLADGGGIVWARKSGDGVWVMTDANDGLDTVTTTPLWCFADGTVGDVARYGLTVDPPGAEGIEGVDEWAIFGDQISRPLWGDQ